jgi:TM2 domain-containing membrane protein YozV
MKCYYHKSREAEYSCKLCSRPLCKDCIEEIKGQYFCKDCVQKFVNGKIEKKIEEEKLTRKSPGGAALLSIVPGLGQIYNGQVIKAIGIIFLFVSLIILIDIYSSGPLFPLLLAAVYLGGIVDAYRTAKLYNLISKGLAPAESLRTIPEGSIWWGIILIIVGLLFLLHNFGIRLYWLSDFWPLLLIAIGVYLLRGFFIRAKNEKQVKEETDINKGEE